MAGHVTLDGKEYRTKGYPRQVLANQMASKIGQGESKYGDAQSWSAWIQENWRGGAGHVNPETDVDGFLWSTAETRVPKQVILPPLLQFSGLSDFSSGTPTESEAVCWIFQTNPAGLGNISTVTVGDGGVDKIAMRWQTPSSGSAGNRHCGFYAQVPYGATLSFSFYTDDGAGNPDAIVGALFTDTVTNYDKTKNFEFFAATVIGYDGSTSLSPSTQYWIVLEVDDAGVDIEVMTTDNASAYATTASTYNGTTWSSQSYYALFYVTADQLFLPVSLDAETSFFRLSSETYVTVQNTIYKWDGTKWVSVISSAGTGGVIAALGVYGPKAWFNHTGEGYCSFDGSSVAVVDATSNYDIIHNDGKYLWVSDANEAWYSADGTTFTGPFQFGGSDASIRGIASLEDRTYFSTDKFLYYLAPGDFVQPVIRWGSEATDNGLGMIEHGGAIYIPANGRLFRFTPDGTLQDVWLDLEDDLPIERIGRIDHLTTMNSWLVAYVNGQGPNPRGAIMVLQGQSWHCLTTLPNETTVVSSKRYLRLFYDRENSRLWIAPYRVGPLYADIPDYAINPFNLNNYLFQPRAWLEWSFWNGTLVEVTKDFESIAITGEGFDANNYVEVYYQEDGDAAGVWTLHGTVTSNFQEIRWGDLATRLTGKRIKIGLLIVSNDSYLTPKIKAVRLQYHLMVNDWFAWNLNIEVVGDLQGQLLPDGTRNSRTAATIKGELDDLCRLDKPFIFIDPLRDQWEVKVKQAEFQYDSYENIEGSSTVKVSGVYHLTLEAVTNGEYTP